MKRCLNCKNENPDVAVMWISADYAFNGLLLLAVPILYVIGAVKNNNSKHDAT